jgi:hypothetical protein
VYRDLENETETREIPYIIKKKSDDLECPHWWHVCVCVFRVCGCVCTYRERASEREREREQREIATEGEEEVILKRCYMKFRIIYS